MKQSHVSFRKKILRLLIIALIRFSGLLGVFAFFGIHRIKKRKTEKDSRTKS